MTKEEIQKKTDSKVRSINTLADSLKVEIIARQMVGQDGFINTVIYYYDKEEYPQDKVEEDHENKDTAIREEEVDN